VNPSTAAARVVVAELIRHGVAHVVLAPGSRSAPLAYAVVAAADRGDLHLHVRIDERVAAFTALGLAHVSGPVAVVTTSGTAVANLHPAVLEAAHAGLPLVVLTADRPHELRGTGANQTTDQVRIFGASVRFFADVPAPVGRAEEAADLRNLLSRALAAAAGVRTGDPGPVHLDLAFREPLVPEAHDASALEITVRGAATVARSRIDVPVPLPRGPRTVVVAGDRAGAAARQLAEAAGLPLLAEPSSGVRGGPNAIGPYRLLLDRPDLGGRIERAVVFGHPTLSRQLAGLLARSDVDVVVVCPGGRSWPDAARRATTVAAAVTMDRGRDADGWLAEWQEAGRQAGAVLDAVLDASAISGPLVAREVAAAGGQLVIGSSNAVRDMDLSGVPADGEVPLVVANRGLAGIDGTVSTATGVALASGTFTRVLLGDLTLLHDIGGLLIGPLEDRPQLQIVVINDDGGGIFALLEHGALEHAAVFERVFGTPHGADIAALCAGFGVSHTLVNDVADLRKALADPAEGRSVVEVVVDRSGHRGLHARIRAALAAADHHREPGE
jgi:2-succinyl-5-enolpyruvyl-6-hydroxy-3-cyclohexene-1-carboxylate synthase